MHECTGVSLLVLRLRSFSLALHAPDGRAAQIYQESVNRNVQLTSVPCLNRALLCGLQAKPKNVPLLISGRVACAGTDQNTCGLQGKPKKMCPC